MIKYTRKTKETDMHGLNKLSILPSTPHYYSLYMDRKKKTSMKSYLKWKTVSLEFRTQSFPILDNSANPKN